VASLTKTSQDLQSAMAKENSLETELVAVRIQIKDSDGGAARPEYAGAVVDARAVWDQLGGLQAGGRDAAQREEEGRSQAEAAIGRRSEAAIVTSGVDSSDVVAAPANGAATPSNGHSQ